MRIHSHGFWIRRTQRPVRDRHFFDAGFAAELLRLAQADGARTLLDIGCGDGRYVHAAAAVGIDAVGYDGNPYTTAIAGPACHVADFAVPQTHLQPADWLISIEVAEHIPAACEFAYLRNLTALAKRSIVISWAPPDQGGAGHINGRPESYVRDVFAKAGWLCDEPATASLRSAATMAWLKTNPLLLRRTLGVSPAGENTGGLTPPCSPGEPWALAQRVKTPGV